MNLRFLSPALALVFASMVAPAQTSRWIPDQAHSEVDFSILHMSLSNVHGRFGDVAGSIVLNKADIDHSAVKITIGVGSIDTGVSARDTVLKSSSFFDVDKYPTATFTSSKVEKVAGGLNVTGNLELHGVTRPVVLHVEGPTGPVTGMDHKPHDGYSAETTINRKDFGIGPSFPSSIVGDDVKLTMDLEVVEQ
ncbi:MAG: YceI family protein [Acidobacteriota bacterium]